MMGMMDTKKQVLPQNPNGISFAVEEGIFVKGTPFSSQNSLLSGFCPQSDAPMVERLKQRGCVFREILKNDRFLSVDPFRKSAVVGEAVAVGAVDFALGIDTGGSLLRQSAAGVSVLRWATATVPPEGILSAAPSFDAVGTVAPNAETALRLWTEFWGTKADEAVAVYPLETDFPLQTALDTYRILSAVELASELGLYDGIRFGQCEACDGTVRERMAAYRGQCMSPERKELLLLGTALVLPPYREACYLRALGNRDYLKAKMKKKLNGGGLIQCPMTLEASVLPALLELSAVSVKGQLLMGTAGSEGALLSLGAKLEREGGDGACPKTELPWKR